MNIDNNTALISTPPTLGPKQCIDVIGFHYLNKFAYFCRFSKVVIFVNPYFQTLLIRIPLVPKRRETCPDCELVFSMSLTED